MKIDVSIDSFSVHAELNLCDLIRGPIPFSDTFENDSYFVFSRGKEITVVDKRNYRLEPRNTLANSNVYFSAHRYLYKPVDKDDLPFIKLGVSSGDKANEIISELFLTKSSFKDAEVAISALEAKYNQRNEELCV